MDAYQSLVTGSTNLEVYNAFTVWPPSIVADNYRLTSFYKAFANTGLLPSPHQVWMEREMGYIDKSAMPLSGTCDMFVAAVPNDDADTPLWDSDGTLVLKNKWANVNDAVYTSGGAMSISVCENFSKTNAPGSGHDINYGKGYMAYNEILVLAPTFSYT